MMLARTVAACWRRRARRSAAAARRSAPRRRRSRRARRRRARPAASACRDSASRRPARPSATSTSAAMNQRSTSGIDIDQRHDAERQDDRAGERHPGDFAPDCMRHRLDGEGQAQIGVDQQQRRRGDVRAVDRRDQRHVDQRRAEAGKAAHQAGEHGDADGAMKARVVQRRRRKVGDVAKAGSRLGRLH